MEHKALIKMVLIAFFVYNYKISARHADNYDEILGNSFTTVSDVLIKTLID